MIGPIKNYKSYCTFYKYILILILITIPFILYSLMTSKDPKMTAMNISQLIMLGVAYFSNRMLLSMCLD
jgi:hypothetical protein